MAGLQTLDWMVVVVYATTVVGWGVVASRRQKSTTDFFLGGRNLAWPLVGISILATAFSASSLLGGPGEAFGHGLLWLQLQLGDLLAILAVCFLFIPFYQALRSTTAYEYLEFRFGAMARVLASLLFQLQVLFRVGVLVYGPALALSTITGIDVQIAIVAVGVVALAYTSLGGMTAVVWTDVLQLAVVIGGVILSCVVVTRGIPGGLSEAFELAAADGRTRIVDVGQSWQSVRSIAGAVIGYGILSLSVAGTNQQPVQRYLSCSSTRDAQKAALTGWAVGAFVTVVTMLLGVLLYAYYKVHLGELPTQISDDAVFPHFVATRLPAGLAGLIVSAIFAAAMSSLDSALHSLTTSSVVDFYERFFRPGRSDEHYFRVTRWVLLAWGIAGIGAGLYVAGKGSLLAMAVRYVGYFAGPVLGLFLLGILTERTNGRGAVVGVATAFLTVIVAVNFERWTGTPFPIGGIWITALGCTVTLLVGGLASRAWPAPSDEQLDGLCLRRRQRQLRTEGDSSL